MFVSKLLELNFLQDDDKHTIRYAAACRQIASRTAEDFIGNVRMVIGDTEEEVVSKMRQQVGEFLLRCWVSPKPEDFSFTMATESVRDGTFWEPWGCRTCHSAKG